MKINSPLIPMVMNYATRPFTWLANTKTMQRACDKFEVSPEKALAVTTLASILGKDSIGCYMYVKQSLNNEKIPEEKRSFVAALDLTNGGLMILSQLLMFCTISNPKVQNKLFGKAFNKIFSEDAKKMYAKAMRKNADFKPKTKEELYKSFDSVKKHTADMFSFLTALAASSIIAKRVLVPFVATPLAGWAQEKMIAASKAKKKLLKQNNNENKTDNFKKQETNKLDVDDKTSQTVRIPVVSSKSNLLDIYTNKQN